MNKYVLQGQIKSTGTAYVLWLLLGAHYAYIGKWGIQILYWITFGGIGIWTLIDLFTMSSKTSYHNSIIYQRIDDIERKDRDSENARNIAMINATK